MNFKFRYLNIDRYEIKALEKYLEEMASDGWLLVYLEDTILRFKKTEKARLKFSVKILDNVSRLYSDENEKSLELKKLYEEAGWNFVTRDFQTNIFVTEDLSLSAPSDTSLKEDLSYAIKKSKKSMAIGFFIYLAASLIIIFRVKNISLFNKSEDIVGLILLFIAVVIAILYNIFNFISFIKFKKAFNKLLEKNDNLEILLESKNIKGKFTFLTYLILVYCLFILILGFTNVVKGLDVFLILILIGLFKKIRFELNYIRTTKNKSTIKYSILAVFSLILAICIIFYNSFIQVESVAAKLTLSDFDQRPITLQTCSRNEKSLISESYTYYAENETTSIYYKLIEVKQNFLVNNFYNATIKFYKDNNNSQSFVEEKQGLPDGMKGVSLSSMPNRLILNIRNKIIVIEGYRNLSENKVIQVIYNKFKIN